MASAASSSDSPPYDPAIDTHFFEAIIFLHAVAASELCVVCRTQLYRRLNKAYMKHLPAVETTPSYITLIRPGESNLGLWIATSVQPTAIATARACKMRMRHHPDWWEAAMERAYKMLSESESESESRLDLREPEGWTKSQADLWFALEGQQFSWPELAAGRSMREFIVDHKRRLDQMAYASLRGQLHTACTCPGRNWVERWETADTHDCPLPIKPHDFILLMEQQRIVLAIVEARTDPDIWALVQHVRRGAEDGAPNPADLAPVGHFYRLWEDPGLQSALRAMLDSWRETTDDHTADVASLFRLDPVTAERRQRQIGPEVTWWSSANNLDVIGTDLAFLAALRLPDVNALTAEEELALDPVVRTKLEHVQAAIRDSDMNVRASIRYRVWGGGA